MSIMKDAQDAVMGILDDKLSGLVIDYGEPLATARLDSGFVDPFATTISLPAAYVYGTGRGSIEDAVGFVPIRMSVMLIQTARPDDAVEAGAVYSDLITDLLVDEVPELSLAFDIQDINVDVYYGPADAKQKVVSLVSFTILAHYRRANR